MYLNSLLTISAQVHRLSENTEIALRSIDAMQGRLVTIRGLLVAQTLTSEDNDEILSSLWERLRPRRADVYEDRRVRRLRDFTVYLAIAANRLDEASRVTQSMRENIERLSQMLSESKTGSEPVAIVLWIDRIEVLLKDLEGRRRITDRRAGEIRDWVMTSVDDEGE